MIIATIANAIPTSHLIISETKADISPLVAKVGKFFDDAEKSWKFAGDGACFYAEKNFKGNAICVRAGEDLPSTESGAVKLGSLRFFGKTKDVDIFSEADYRGERSRIAGENPDMSMSPMSRLGSARVY